MYNILIVDDEDIEREGIAYLIEEYKLPFYISMAENGKKAIEYLQTHNVDVLFTDIKMPYVDGLELANRAREIAPDIKIIIYSAYGEFEYAKKAISLNVVYYILKPIIINEFVDTMKMVIKICDNDEENRENNIKLLKGYEKSILFEKQKLLLDILSTSELSENLLEGFKNRLDYLNMDYTGKHMLAIMIDFRNRFFDSNSESFTTWLENNLSWEYENINLNERQSLLLLKVSENGINKEQLYYFCDYLRRWFIDEFDSSAYIIIGREFNQIEDLGKEYAQIEQALDCRFFIDDSAVMYAEDINLGKNYSDDIINKILNDINISINDSNLNTTKIIIEKLFDLIKNRGKFSPVYVKYICTDIAKRIYSINKMENTEGISQLIDSVFKSTTLQELEELLFICIDNSKVNGHIEGLKPGASISSSDLNKKAIKSIQQYIHENYMKDISLESIAKEVFLSPGYISGFFKKETGKSLVKYMTCYRMDKAKELLQNTNMKIVDITEKVGYSNTSYFCTAFKNHFGISPAKYRGMED